MTTNQQLPQRLNPETDLTWARTGTEYFLDLMARIDQPQLADPSLLSGWTRGHVIAHIGYNARALHRLLTWARTGEELPMYDSSEQRSEEIESGATLSKDALLSLVTNSDADLATAWRTLPPDRWSFPVRTAQGRTVTVSETAWMRAREVWIHAVDLNTGGSFDHFPPQYTDALIGDVIQTWRRRAHKLTINLNPTDRDWRITADIHTDNSATGTAANIAQWLTGRGQHNIHLPHHGAAPKLPTWL
jgi:maleylpyruvate isomerase